MKNFFEKLKGEFKDVGTRLSRLFFVLADLMNVDPMYQYSLEFYKKIYMRAIRAANDKGIEKNDKAGRKEFFIRRF